MLHVMILGLILTLVIGLLSFAVLTRRLHRAPSRLPSTIPIPLLLYNVWIAAWLASQYVAEYVCPEISPATTVAFASTSGSILGLVSLAWLASHFALIDEFVGTVASRHVAHVVRWLATGLAGLIAVGWALAAGHVGTIALGPATRHLVSSAIFPAALAGCVVLYLGARAQQDAGIRRALAVLAWMYGALFSGLALLVLVGWRYDLASREILLSSDIALEMVYNIMTVVWLSRFAGVFEKPLPAAPQRREDFNTLCDSLGVTKREREVIELLCQGMTNQEIADRLFISPGTVKDHNYAIFQKAGVRNRTELAALFMIPSAPGATRVPESARIRRVV
jgi:DNA-binding CsgD family transcriptional regulator